MMRALGLEIVKEVPQCESDRKSGGVATVLSSPCASHPERREGIPVRGDNAIFVDSWRGKSRVCCRALS